MKNNSAKYLTLICFAALCSGCITARNEHPSIPAMEYTENLKKELSRNGKYYVGALGAGVPSSVVNATKARLHLVSDGGDQAEAAPEAGLPDPRDTITNDPTIQRFDSTMRDTREYNGPLSLGDPGMTASLWRENRGTNDLFRDQRAWQPMDLITITVSENAEGSKQADTEVKSKTSIEAAIEQLFNFDDDLKSGKANAATIDPSSLINASTKNEFKGEGETSRKGKLKAKISAMVAEVLPSGILRIEGKKIISVNNEEQIMIISGLVRPYDISSGNEVDSSKIANMRIDYYGNGIVGEAQYGGWLGRILHVIWPF